MSKQRIYEYAKELNLKSKEIIDELKSMNVEVSNHMQALEDDQIKALDKKFKPGQSNETQKNTQNNHNKSENKQQNNQKQNNNKSNNQNKQNNNNKGKQQNNQNNNNNKKNKYKEKKPRTKQK